MTARLLPPDEWAAKLAGTELETVWPHFNSDASVIVIESGDQVIGCWALFPFWQVEGVWIAPEHRRGGRVAVKLLQEMSKLTSLIGVRRVETGALTPQVEALLEHLGAEQIPGSRYVIPTENLSCQPQ